MNFWLILIGVAVVMLMVGIAIQAASVLLWIGVIVLIVSIVMSALQRTDANH